MTERSEPTTIIRVITPQLRQYSPAFMRDAAQELEQLPKRSNVAVMIVDYGNLRERIRAMRGDFKSPE